LAEEEDEAAPAAEVGADLGVILRHK